MAKLCFWGFKILKNRQINFLIITKKLKPKGSNQRQITDKIRNFNKGVDGFEKAWEKLYGRKIHLDRLTVNDFK